MIRTMFEKYCWQHTCCSSLLFSSSRLLNLSIKAASLFSSVLEILVGGREGGGVDLRARGWPEHSIGNFCLPFYFTKSFSQISEIKFF
jgi:hypothetical protein